MHLIGTMILGSNAFAIYAAEGVTLDDVWAKHALLYNDTILHFDVCVRLVQIGTDPPPAKLPLDLSESL